MNNINILVLSDIHFNKMEANDQGLVLSGLFKDLETQLPISERDNNWCIIAGDLVQAGVDIFYENFSNKFLSKLYKYVPQSQIIFIAGNHDLNRTTLKTEKDAHTALLNSNHSLSFQKRRLMKVLISTLEVTLQISTQRFVYSH